MIERGTVNISTGIVFRTILIVLGLVFMFFIRDIIAIVFIAIVIVAAIDPIIIRMQRYHIGRTVSVSLIYVLTFLILGSFFSFVVPPAVGQMKDFSQKIPGYMNEFGITFQGLENLTDAKGLIKNLNQGPVSISDNIFTTTLGIFSGLLATIIVLVITFYMAVNEDGIKHFVVSLSPEKHKKYVASLTDRIKIKIGRWMLGQVFLMFLIFSLDLIGLLILNVPYALALAIFAGLMEVIPFIGPIISAIPATIIGFTISPWTGFLVLILFTITQQFEGHIIVPQVMKKAVGLHPIAVILALLIGFKLGGVFGAVLSIPVATALSVFISDLFEKDSLSQE
jgi:predicted PurR-regulated permease PerM